MPATIINGKKIAENIKSTARDFILMLREEGYKPCLSVILVGDDPASQVYVRQKERACAEVGLMSRIIRLPSDCTQRQLEKAITSQVDDKGTVGVLVQLPLPLHLNAKSALSLIPPYKDVDGFSDENVARLWKGETAKHYACTPYGIMSILTSTKVNLCGKHAVVIGRSNTVGKPLAAMLLNKNCTVTICHSQTNNLREITRQADIVIAAVGKPNMVTADMIKPNAIVIDVGINRMPVTDEYGRDTGKTKLIGDVDFDAVKEVASFITPVPGGVGPVTVAQLMLNTAITALAQRERLKDEQYREEEARWLKSISQETSTEISVNLK